MRHMTTRLGAAALPFAAPLLTALLGQGTIYLFVHGHIGLPAALAAMLVLAAIVVAGVAMARSESERRWVAFRPAPALLFRRAPAALASASRHA